MGVQYYPMLILLNDLYYYMIYNYMIYSIIRCYMLLVQTKRYDEKEAFNHLNNVSWSIEYSLWPYCLLIYF